MSTSDPDPDFLALLQALAVGGVEFVVVGGVCGVPHGAPVSTFDLDVVFSREPENRLRLERLLSRLQARYREKPEQTPDAQTLDSSGHHLLMTIHGPLDLLGSTVGGKGFRELLARTELVELGEGMQVRILDLPALIEMKAELGRDRDKAVLPILRRTLEERARNAHGA